MNSKRCALCAYFYRHSELARKLGRGLCRRYPPVPDSDQFAGQPNMAPEDWCGEFAPGIPE